jgi:hypothetical protein
MRIGDESKPAPRFLSVGFARVLHTACYGRPVPSGHVQRSYCEEMITPLSGCSL